MIVLTWLVGLVGGLALAWFASTRTVTHARALIEGSRIPPFLVGATFLAIGTDLPEIANSVIASFSDHGDLNVGDSVGSAVTQATLVLGLLPLICGSFAYRRGRILVILSACVLALGLGALLVSDGFLSRADGLALVTSWLLGSFLIWRSLSPAAEPAVRVETPSRAYHAAATITFLAVVGIGAAVAVAAFVRLSILLDVPEYILSFFVASVGTSLPELVVDVKALRAGLRDLALGGILGSSFVDSTLSIGIGPSLFPVAVTASLAVHGAIIAIGVLGAVALTLVLARKHNWLTGSTLILLYAAVYLLLLA